MRFTHLTIFTAIATLQWVCASTGGSDPAPAVPGVLIISSYDAAHFWTRAVLASEIEHFQTALRAVDIRTEYMDFKRYPGDDNVQSFRSRMQLKYADSKLDLVLTNDNAALDFVLRYRDELFPRVPVVFAGLNGYEAYVDRLPPDVTGIAEKIDPLPTLELAIRLHPQAKTCHIIADMTASGVETRKEIERLLPDVTGDCEFHFADSRMTMAELCDHLAAADPSDIVYMTYYNRDGGGNYFSHEQSVIHLVAACSMPVYHAYESALGQGIVGGYLLNEKAHGAAAAEMGVRILRGEDPTAIFSLPATRSTPMFDWKALRRYGIPEYQLPPGSIVINRPQTVVSQYGRSIVIAAGVFMVQTGVIAALVITLVTRQRARQELRHANENLRITLDSIGDAVIATDREGRITRMNPIAEQLTGWQMETAIRRPLSDVLKLRGPDGANLEALAQTAMEEGGRRFPVEKCIATARDGRERIVSDSGAPILDDSGRTVGAVLVFRDVTSEARLEEQLRQSQKMDSIGQLAGGVAHDFNNMLAAIIGAAEIIAASDGLLGAEREAAEMILDSAAKAAELTHKLLSFSRKGKIQSTAVEVHDTIMEAVSILKRSIDKRVSIATDCAARKSTVIGDPLQIENAVINLGLNARDAMPDGGEIHIATRTIEFSDEVSEGDMEPIPAGTYLELSVRDSGVGIPPEVQRHIFEPFFTTKDVGHGTGLGLAAVYGTVKDHGGFIRVESEIGKGSVFTLFLPVTEVDGGASATRTQYLIKGRGTVMVVDDEPIVRRVGAKLLNDLGYDVIEAEDGATAVESYRRYGNRVSLILLDVVMPGISGVEAARELEKVNPQVKILFTSGFTRDSAIGGMLRNDRYGFIQKPYRRLELSEAVAALIQDE